MSAVDGARLLQELREWGALSSLDVHFATTLAALVGEERLEVLLGAALVSRRTREGHVCVRLRDLAERPIEEASELGHWPALATWHEALATSPLVQRTDEAERPELGRSEHERRPLVLDDEGKLYLHRYYEHERRLAELLRRRTSGALQETVAQLQPLRPLLARWFDTPNGASWDDQRVALFVALMQRFVIISGGPGTGKTSTVARLLALLVELALQQGQEPPRILLLAPTGKAAGRLVESIRQAKSRLALPAEVLEALPEAASTIHRALGVRSDGPSRFQHDAQRPLIADVVLVDEASMVDLALMRHLVEAVPVGARLILLGDRYQLASVEAGSVLGELCRAAGGAGEGSKGGATGYGAELCEAAERLTGQALRQAAGEPPLLRDHVVELTKSYRFDGQSGIGRLATAIREGDLDGVHEALAQGSDVVWVERAPEQELSAELKDCVLAGFRPLFEAETAEQALEALSTFRVLCAHRRGWAGVEHLNERIRGALLRAGLIRERGDLFRGRALIVTQNDYSVGLFNGDVGVVFGPPSQRKAFFEGAVGSETSVRSLSPARLPAHETAFALSVHKSQGSEHDEVAVVLPEAGSPLLCRELLYTAVTRAKQRVRLFASRGALEQAVERRVARTSGLADMLTREAPSESNR